MLKITMPIYTATFPTIFQNLFLQPPPPPPLELPMGTTEKSLLVHLQFVIQVLVYQFTQ